jgi:hypothetical protein
LSGSSSNAFDLLILEDGSYWAVYGSVTQTATTRSTSIAGFVQGTGVYAQPTFKSFDARDFGFTPAMEGIVDAVVSGGLYMNGTIAMPAGNVTFNGVAPAYFDYNTAASVSTITGLWMLYEGGVNGETAAVNVAANGQFTAQASSGCNFGGTILPRPSGKNVYNVSFTFGGAPCALAGQAVTGIAYTLRNAIGAQELVVTAVDATRQYGGVMWGSR